MGWLLLAGAMLMSFMDMFLAGSVSFYISWLLWIDIMDWTSFQLLSREEGVWGLDALLAV